MQDVTKLETKSGDGTNQREIKSVCSIRQNVKELTIQESLFKQGCKIT